MTSEEAAFFTAHQPLGFILFARNIDSRAQVSGLVRSLRATTRHDALVLIDQEGGRVARLKGDLAHIIGPMARIGALFDKDPEGARQAARLTGRLLALDLSRLGIDVDCAPVLDVPAAGSHDVIGDRAFSTDPGVVARLGGALAEGLTAGGVLPVAKHVPGHGRAEVDSHLALPVVTASREVLEATDFAPFKALSSLHLAMTAHVRYDALDLENCATFSSRVIEEIVRGYIGFDGLLMTDDLSMQALGGDFADRAGRALAAGCDILLHCNGRMDEMSSIQAAGPRLTPMGERRALAVLAARRAAGSFDPAEALARLETLLPGFVQ